MEKVPVGTFLIPMLISAVINTISPGFFREIGGVTNALFGGQGNTFIIGMLTFISGIGIDVNSLIKLFKRHGLILLTKFILVVVLSLLYINVFGMDGIFGISALAFVIAMIAVNPSLYISLVEDYGDEMDPAAFGLTALFSIPAFPMLIFGLGGSGNVDWMPIISAIIPMIVGIILGNLDPDFRQLFDNGIALLIPVLGWNIGQSLNLIQGLQAGIFGVLLAVLYYIVNSPIVLLDKKILKNDGIAATSMLSISATSASFTIVLAQAFPELSRYVQEATAQIILAAIITIVLTPIIVTKMTEKQQSSQ
ncbi:2-keto-3-deoxygluconate permease [Aerococcaceae bacterium DSM 111020]|nr:2-keto-3-deoxygluconate permease [Aerococcaceae bacterium DSM 111020]